MLPRGAPLGGSASGGAVWARPQPPRRRRRGARDAPRRRRAGGACGERRRAGRTSSSSPPPRAPTRTCSPRPCAPASTRSCPMSAPRRRTRRADPPSPRHLAPGGVAGGGAGHGPPHPRPGCGPRGGPVVATVAGRAPGRVGGPAPAPGRRRCRPDRVVAVALATIWGSCCRPPRVRPAHGHHVAHARVEVRRRRLRHPLAPTPVPATPGVVLCIATGAGLVAVLGRSLWAWQETPAPAAALLALRADASGCSATRPC